MSSFFFFFNDTATTEIYTLSLHDALPIYLLGEPRRRRVRDRIVHVHQLEPLAQGDFVLLHRERQGDRKSTRLNSSHSQISYAVFCLKKKKKNTKHAYIVQLDTYIRIARQH